MTFEHVFACRQIASALDGLVPTSANLPVGAETKMRFSEYLDTDSLGAPLLFLPGAVILIAVVVGVAIALPLALAALNIAAGEAVKAVVRAVRARRGHSGGPAPMEPKPARLDPDARTQGR
jgi:hypothetical protein